MRGAIFINIMTKNSPSQQDNPFFSIECGLCSSKWMKEMNNRLSSGCYGTTNHACVMNTRIEVDATVHFTIMNFIMVARYTYHIQFSDAILLPSQKFVPMTYLNSSVLLYFNCCVIVGFNTSWNFLTCGGLTPIPTPHPQQWVAVILKIVSPTTRVTALQG